MDVERAGDLQLTPAPAAVDHHLSAFQFNGAAGLEAQRAVRLWANRVLVSRFVVEVRPEYLAVALKGLAVENEGGVRQHDVVRIQQEHLLEFAGCDRVHFTLKAA
jgi:hypothetical protein